MDPIMKWAGGKRKLLSEIKKVINFNELSTHRLFETFIGGGALSFDVLNEKTTINDINPELINVYIQIRDNPQELIRILKMHKENNTHDYFYMIRNLDRNDSYSLMSNVQKAARTIYLNRVCYNGLYRVNSKGFFNVPYGRYVNPEIVFEDKIYKISSFLKNSKVKITCKDFEEAVKNAKKGDVVYFDPPYDYDDNGFTSYTKKGFSRNDLKRLKRTCDRLIENGCHIIVSNNDTSYVNDLFSDSKYKFNHIYATRMINCDGKKRKSVKEVIIYG